MRLPLWLVLVCAAAPASGDPLPAATTSATCTDGTQIEGPASCTNGGASATVGLAPFAGDRAHASVPASTPQQLFSAGATADVQYAFQVAGGTIGDLVPVVVTANVGATSTSHSHGFASIFVHTSQDDTQVCADTTQFGCPATPFAGSFTVHAFAGEVGTVNLEVEASAGTNLAAPESATASADPLVAVDPAFPNADQYTIQLSPGVANALPEPSSSASIATSLLALAFGPRPRRRRRPRSSGLASTVKTRSKQNRSLRAITMSIGGKSAVSEPPATTPLS